MHRNIDFHAVPLSDRTTTNLMVTIFEELEINREHLAKHLGEGTADAVVELMTNQRVSGRYKEFNLLPGAVDVHGFEWILLLGLGKRSKIRHQHRLHDRLRSVIAIAARQFRRKGLGAFAADDLTDFGVAPEVSGRLIVEGAMLGTYRFHRYKTKSDDAAPNDVPIADVYLLTDGNQGALADAIENGVARATSTCLARDLVNTPAKDLTPLGFADEAKRVADSEPELSFELLSSDDMEREGMGLHLGVGRGSNENPCVAIVHYAPRGESSGWDMALVGKGVTFDSGGYNIKPSSGMTRMYGDMAGAAAVLGAMRSIAQQRLDLNVVGVMPLSENLVSGKAYKPGDVLSSHHGRTVEITNTDAEGRLLLADSLSYTCQRYKPAFLVDIATLTGAIVVALGHFVSGLFTHANSTDEDDAFAAKLFASGREAGEWLWRMPIDDDYKVQIASDVADLANCSTDRATGAGAITAAVFLKEFVDFDVVKAWAHIDIASSALMERALIYNKSPYQPREGATGVGVRLLSSLAAHLEDPPK